jgi:hypothetical protein
MMARFSGAQWLNYTNTNASPFFAGAVPLQLG